MSIFNDKSLKGVSEAVSKIMDEELKGNQHKIDANKNGKVDAHDFKLLRAKKDMKEEAEKMAKKDHDQDGKVESGKAEYLGSRIRAAKMAGKMKEEAELDEAFPTVADAKKRMDAGKTSSGTVTKTKTGLVHKRDYKDDDNDSEDMQKKSKAYGARQNFKRSTRVNEQLSFTEMLHLYNESGVEVISKIVPQTVKFGDTEVELIDANIVNGAVGITVAEEVDNETFTKEVEAQKAKAEGKGKKAEVAKASVQAVKQEEVELEERAKWRTSSIAHNTGYRKDGAHGGIENTADTGKEDLLKNRFMHSRYGSPTKSDIKGLKKSITKNLSQMKKEEVEQIDEADIYSIKNKKTGQIYHHSKYPITKNTQIFKRIKSAGGDHVHATIHVNGKPIKEDVEQIDEISKKTLGSYIKAASHDVAAKGAFTRHFADKSRAETAAQRPDLARKTMKKADKMQDAGMKRRANMAKAVDRLTKEDIEQIDERTLTSGETAKKEDYVKGMKKSVSGFKARYGDKAKSVMYATATKMAKKD